MDDSYFVKISGTGTIHRRIDEVNELMHRFNRVKLELEGIRKEKNAKRKDLLNQVNEMLEGIEKLQTFMPTKEETRREEKKRKKKGEKKEEDVVETVEEPMELEKVKEVRKKAEKIDLGGLKDELKRLKDELEK